MAVEGRLKPCQILTKRTIRAAETPDAKPIADIDNHYVTESAITFEEEPVTTEEIGRRMEQVRSASLPASG